MLFRWANKHLGDYQLESDKGKLTVVADVSSVSPSLERFCSDEGGVIFGH